MTTLSTIIGLFLWCSPAAVVWVVWAIVIPAVKRKTNRPESHVGEKVIEGVEPPVAHCDAPTTIPRPVFAPGIDTSVPSAIPASVGWAFGQTVGGTFGSGDTGDLTSEAPATPSVPGFESIDRALDIGSAIADAMTPDTTVLAELENNSQSIELESNILPDSHSETLGGETQ